MKIKNWHGIITQYRTRLRCIHMLHIFCNALVHGIYLGVSGRCSHTIMLIHSSYFTIIHLPFNKNKHIININVHMKSMSTELLDNFHVPMFYAVVKPRRWRICGCRSGRWLLTDGVLRVCLGCPKTLDVEDETITTTVVTKDRSLREVRGLLRQSRCISQWYNEHYNRYDTLSSDVD